jgi:tRNA 2-selenouridine synthase
MALTFLSLIELLDHSYDSVIDVRSPDEFAEDHIPGAINLPVLDNDERAKVGTMYVQQSRFLARKLGAAMVFRNTARHVETALAEKDGGWQPLVYCWRGGQRSGSFTWLLQQIGWRAEVIEGGYQTYRRLVKTYLYDTPLAHQLVALDGYTGTAKTDLLKQVKDLGVQVLDLEGLANHRGSLLGGMNGPQPSQKAFETKIAAHLARLDPSRPVLVEAESSKIGDRIIPPSLWTAMKVAPRIQVAAPVAARCRYLVMAYDDILSDAVNLRRKLEPLRAHRSNAVVDHWLALIAAGDKAALTESLMVQHYDPSYAKSRQTVDAEVIAEVQVAELDANGLADAADQIAKLMQSHSAS